MKLYEAIFLIRKSIEEIYETVEAESIAYIVVEFVKGYSRIECSLHKEEFLSMDEVSKIKEIVSALEKGTPIQQVIGKTIFFDLEFLVNKHVLIPRSETEELIDLIISNNLHENPRVLDIGTGSGCIAVTLAKNIKNSRVFAVDISDGAIEVAKENANLNSVHVDFAQSDILNATRKDFSHDFDIIASNPPYVTMKEKCMMHRNVLDFEPHTALFVPDDDPLVFYKKIADLARDLLSDKGKLYFEINENYGNNVAQLLENYGYSNINVHKDLHQRDRMVSATF